jgi:hypothetical protein
MDIDEQTKQAIERLEIVSKADNLQEFYAGHLAPDINLMFSHLTALQSRVEELERTGKEAMDALEGWLNTLEQAGTTGGMPANAKATSARLNDAHLTFRSALDRTEKEEG